MVFGGKDKKGFFDKIKDQKEPIIDRLKYDGPSDTLCWRHPQDNLTWGTQVIVNQSQEALFYKGGAALDLLEPGTHTLKTANIPLLRNLISIPFGDETPFAAEVYYVNKVVNLDVKWGTREPMLIEDPKYRVMLPVRAFGQFGVRVVDTRKFVTELVGTVSTFDTKKLVDYFRGVVLTKAKDRIAEVLVKEKIALLEISAYLEDISQQLAEPIGQEFEKFGISVVNFNLNSINVPQDDEAVKRLREALSKRAEFDIIGDDRYRMERTFDTLETAAGNEGTAGGMMGAGMGMGLGVGVGMPMGQMAGNMMNQMAPSAQQAQPQQAQPAAAPAATVACTSCGAQIAQGAKFCPECGDKQVTATAVCASCNAVLTPGAKFCPECGAKQEQAPTICSACNAELAPGAKFCAECGQKTT